MASPLAGDGRIVGASAAKNLLEVQEAFARHVGVGRVFERGFSLCAFRVGCRPEISRARRPRADPAPLSRAPSLRPAPADRVDVAAADVACRAASRAGDDGDDAVHVTAETMSAITSSAARPCSLTWFGSSEPIPKGKLVLPSGAHARGRKPGRKRLVRVDAPRGVHAGDVHRVQQVEDIRA